MNTVEQSYAYLGADAAADFYGTRATDGDRPRIYSGLLADQLAGMDLLLGLGCGDSAVEYALIGASSHDVPTYHAVDIGVAMLERTAHTFEASSSTPVLHNGDFLAPSFVPTAQTILASAHNPVVSLLGRTFGNMEPEWLLPRIKAVVRGAPLLVDFYGGSRQSVEQFSIRMAEVAIHSAEFFLNAARRKFAIARDAKVRAVFETRPYGVVCRFVTADDTLECFSIRFFFADMLSELANKHGLAIVADYEIEGQLLPMRLIVLHPA